MLHVTTHMATVLKLLRKQQLDHVNQQLTLDALQM
jgi:hypothetical protein